MAWGSVVSAERKKWYLLKSATWTTMRTRMSRRFAHRGGITRREAEESMAIGTL
jgi:hypothetical protein